MWTYWSKSKNQCVKCGFANKKARARGAVALFAAVFAQYQVATRERLVLPAADLTKLARYVRAYQGPYQPLLAKYLQLMRGR